MGQKGVGRVAGRMEKIRTDLATLERINEDAIGAASGRERRELIERPPTRASASVAR